MESYDLPTIIYFNNFIPFKLKPRVTFKHVQKINVN